MYNAIKRVFTIIFAALFLVSCAPNRAMTKTSDGMSGHGVKVENAQNDKTYASDDDFDLENAEIEQAGSNPVPAVKAAKKSSSKEVKIANDTEPSLKNSPVADTSQQKGKASWYGREFHGKKTASGEKFDMNRLTAAHKTLPLGTVVLVKNLDNGKSVQVKINDRGPFKKGRILDLSFAAAKKLDMISSGEANVSIQEIDSADKEFASEDSDQAFDDESLNVKEPKPAKKSKKVKAVSYTEPQEGKYAIQTGAFYSKRNAEKLKTRIEEIFPDRDIQLLHDGDFYKVKISGIMSKRDADRCKKSLSEDEIDSFIVNPE